VKLDHAEAQELGEYESDRPCIVIRLPKEVEINFDIICVFDPKDIREFELLTLWGRSQ
jgi:hypothetical protein